MALSKLHATLRAAPRTARVAWIALAGLAWVACDGPPGVDAGARDVDSDVADASVADASLPSDGGARDSGLDAGPTADSGTGDAGGSDAGTNRPPSPASGLVIAPAAPLTTMDLGLTFAEGVDPDGDTVVAQVVWVRDGSPTPFMGPTLAARETRRGEAWQATVTMSDFVASSTPVSASVVIGNSPPTAPMVEIRDVGGALVCAVATPGTDDDRDPLAYTASWTREGGAYTTTESLAWEADLVAVGVAASGETWSCSMVASDGTLASAPSAPATLTIGNVATRAVMVAGFTSCLLNEAGELRCVGHDIVGLVRDAPTVPLRAVGSGTSSGACGLGVDGFATCWGQERYGANRPPAVRFTQVGSGAFHACGLREDGEAECWGRNNVGQTDPAPGPFVQLAVGTHHACGRASTGEVRCWGDDDAGQATPPPGLSFVDVAANRGTCGITDAGDLRCWGVSGALMEVDGSFARVALSQLSVCTLDAAGVAQCQDSSGSDVVATTPTRPLSTITGASDTYCGLAIDDGERLCWGRNHRLQAEPIELTVAELRMSRTTICARFLDGSARCFAGTSGSRPDLTAGRFSTIGAGLGFACGLHAATGLLECFGASAPTVSTDVIYSELDVGPDGLCAIRASNGAVECFGAVASPPIPMLLGAARVSVGPNYVCAQLISDGTLRCWIPGGPHIATLSGAVQNFDVAGSNVVCGVLTGGALECVGDAQLAAVPLGSFDAVAGWSVSGQHLGCAARTSGPVSCWGSGTSVNGALSPPVTGGRAVEVHDYDGLGTGCVIDGASMLRCWGLVGR